MRTISMSTFFHQFVFRYLVVALFIIACVSFIENTEADPAELAKDEGVIIGSIIVNVASPREGSSFGRSGRKLARAKWALEIVKSKGFSRGRYIKVKTGVERHFLKKLRAGPYRFTQLAGQGSFSLFSVPLDMQFTVAPQVSSYLGRIEVTVPYRHREGRVSVRLVDAQNETVKALKEEYPKYVTGVTKGLMVIAR